MNALQRDLKRLVPLAEKLGADTVAADCHRQHYHIQPGRWLNTQRPVLFTMALPRLLSGTALRCFRRGQALGSCRSTDLIHWEPLPVMLYPDQPFDCHGAYSAPPWWKTELCICTTPASKAPRPTTISPPGGATTCACRQPGRVTLDSKHVLCIIGIIPLG